MKEVVIELIKCDLINAKMINTLNRIEIEASTYRVNITPVILTLLEVQEKYRSEALYGWYFDLLEENENYDDAEGGLDAVSLKIYELLLIAITMQKGLN